MITKKEVQHIAKLARLDLSEEEIVKFQKEFSSILDYVEKLKEVKAQEVKTRRQDVSGVGPVSRPFATKNIMREDEPEEKYQAGGEKLMSLAPEVKNGHLKVKRILQ